MVRQKSRQYAFVLLGWLVAQGGDDRTRQGPGSNSIALLSRFEPRQDGCGRSLAVFRLLAVIISMES